MINGCVNAKIEIFKDEPMVELQNINILMHYNSILVEQAICDISHANKNYNFTYEVHLAMEFLLKYQGINRCCKRFGSQFDCSMLFLPVLLE